MTMPEMARLTFILLAVCFVSATALSFSYSKTAPVIAQNRLKAREIARRAVLPGAVKVVLDKNVGIDLASLPANEFSELCSILDDEQEKAKAVKVYRGIDAEGKTVGYAFQLASKGFSGDIAIMVGAAPGENGRLVVTGTKVLKHSETPGLGAEMTTKSYSDICALADKAVPKFQKQFIGKCASELVLKKENPASGTIDALTAATISSRAFTIGVRKGLELLARATSKGKGLLKKQ